MAITRSLTAQEIDQFLKFAELELVSRGEYSALERQERSFPMAVLTSTVEQDGAISEDMFIGENVIGFRFFEYRGWQHLADSVERRFNLMNPFLQRLQLGIQSVGLEIEDHFFSDETESVFSLDEVFNLEGPYMPPALTGVRHSWESNLQWFTDEGEFSFMNVLRFESSPIEVEPSARSAVQAVKSEGDASQEVSSWLLLTKIMHRQHFFSRTLRELNKPVREALDILHLRNNRLMRETLSAEMILQVGLKEAE